MHQLVVLSGHMGTGKSTLTKKVIEKLPHLAVRDVFDHIVKYKNEVGYISDEDTAKAYDEVYQELELLNQDTILEIGVRNPEFNLVKLNDLKSKFDITIICCLLDKDICIKRVMERGKQGQKYVIQRDRLENKFKIPFPDIHFALAQKLQIPIKNLDMSKSSEEFMNTIVKSFC